MLEVYHAMRAQVGPDFPVSIKLNSADFQRGGFSEDESLDTIRALADAGIDLLEISGGNYEEPAMTGIAIKESTKMREAYFMDFAEKARKVCTIPIAVTGGFRTAEGMANAISSNAVDFVGIARHLAIETDVPNKLLSGKLPKHSVKPIKTGIPMIDNMGIMEVSWYSAQLKRIGNGKKPNVDASPFLEFLKSIFHQIGITKRLPSRLRAK